MRFTITSATLAAVLAATSASAANTQVQVGNGGLTFNPSSVNASAGDTITFTFYPKNHTATQVSFDDPCEPLDDGLDSDFMPVANTSATAPTFVITVNDTTPLWFSCQQTGHCEQGMVFAVNPTANKTFAAFQANAKDDSSDDGDNSTTGSSTATGASASSTSTKKNSALSSSAGAGGLLAAVGLAAGVLL